MPSVEMLHIALGGKEFKGVRAADPLHGAGRFMSLSAGFHQKLLDAPAHLMASITIPDYPLVRLQWISLCQTAGLALLRSGSPEPDVFFLLLNGLESEEELATIRSAVPALIPHWPKIEAAGRPVAVAGYTTPSRMADPAVATVLWALANAHFTQFGRTG